MTLAVLLLALPLVTHAATVTGSSSATFDDPTDDVARYPNICHANEMVTEHVGTSVFDWGTPSPNAPPSTRGECRLQFDGLPFGPVATETPFKIGTLLYRNKTTWPCTQAGGVTLNVTLTLTNPSGVTKAFGYVLDLDNTNNLNYPVTDPRAWDYVKWTNGPQSQTFKIGTTVYILELTGFGSLSSIDGFTSVDEFHVREGSTASADLYAKVTTKELPTTLTCASPVCSCNGDAVGSATLSSGGTAVANKTVQFFLDGATVGVSSTTNSSGVATADLGSFQSLMPGPHSFIAKFAGDDDYLPSDSNGCNFNAPWNTQISNVSSTGSKCGVPVTLSATLKQESNTRGSFPDAVQGAVLKFEITRCGSTAVVASPTGTTDVNGVATASWTPPCADNYTFTVSYAGNQNCLCPSSNTSGSFTVFTSITVCKFKDCNMNGRQDSGEPGISGWPVSLTGTTNCPGPTVGPLNALTGADGCYTFDGLLSGDYVVSEQGNGIVWEKATECCALRTTWNSKRWQFTGALLNGAPYAFDPCTGNPPAVPINLCCGATVAFGNVPLGTVTAFKFHDLNMNGTYEPNGEPYVDRDHNGIWTPGEQFTDLNCNGTWDQGEFFVDANKNGVRDLGDLFTDLDGDHTYDYPECPVQGWPFTLKGTSRDGCLISRSGVTDGNGDFVFQDIPPAATSYTLREDAAWTQVVLPTETVYRTSQTGTLHCGCGSNTTINRWEATTPIQVQFPLDCGASYSSNFGNVCLTTVDGIKEVYTNGVPGQVPKDPDASGWHIVLAGKDVKGRDVVPTLSIGPPGGPSVLVPMASKAPISVPCLTPQWYELTTPTDGSFHFLDLPPGHYHLTEQPDHPDFRLDMDKPMMSGFDVKCCPVQTVMRNIKDGTTVVYQAYCGSSCGDPEADQQIFGGFKGGLGDPITAVPGVLAFDPGPGWQNYVRATELCREARITNVSLRKFFEGNDVCPDYFKPVDMHQQGSAKIRDWWPLMYEPPTTSWTLTVSYDTATVVQFPGETQASVHHQDQWKWTVVTDIEHMKYFIDLIHELPIGSAQKPILSDEVLFKQLKVQLDEIDALVKANQKGEAGMKLDTFILDVEDACITEPCVGSQFGNGLANTAENPACCKLILDAEYLAKTLGLWNP